MLDSPNEFAVHSIGITAYFVALKYFVVYLLVIFLHCIGTEVIYTRGGISYSDPLNELANATAQDIFLAGDDYNGIINRWSIGASIFQL